MPLYPSSDTIYGVMAGQRFSAGRQSPGSKKEERSEMPVSKNAETVLERRYLIRDESGKVTETVEGLFHRVAGSIAGADKPLSLIHI